MMATLSILIGEKRESICIRERGEKFSFRERESDLSDWRSCENEKLEKLVK